MGKHLVLFKFVANIQFYVIAGLSANELIMATVIQALEDSCNQLLRSQVDKRAIIDNLDLTLLAIDEIVDEGIILASDPDLIVNRVLMRDDNAGPMQEQTIAEA